MRGSVVKPICKGHTAWPGARDMLLGMVLEGMWGPGLRHTRPNF